MRLPKELIFWKDFFGKTDEPNHNEELRTLFTSPLWVSEKALQFFGEATLIQCLVYLRKKAQRFNGINDCQKIFDNAERLPPLLFLEEGTDDVTPSQRSNTLYGNPIRTVAILRDEYSAYVLRYGDEWAGLRKIEVI